MDIQVSSNFERLLFELLDRDGARVAVLMQQFAKTGSFAVAEDVSAVRCQFFLAFALMMRAQKKRSKSPMKKQV